ncbi:cytochrome P450 [Streptomyces sp. NBC_00257]|uniref:cytochrome P450 n=1 Tax=unclassified Streptomyces TaxID=2593676 RepID=UPI00225BE38F|nr:MULTISPECIES: cytochrome P450 [unclassified Streptomyces]WTB55602.1 cytochrome P450 [Streptomyces sp. NBC_00826]WTH91516.1 cytochrome P450 [Streptomyces sp. NBC_00825]WTI00244.1 cytochrome P450 [Streptomyces sp. NBC_00822]MCX4865746.1 cytochrome P450 [Streptomyces sp. NBC_00906]MCX4896985.1 cytochrome P450 [Streptomyces sp. NBC_00892]
MSDPVPAERPVPDVFDPRQYGQGIPHAHYRHLRDHHPVAWQEEPEVLGWPAGPGFWAVTRHEDVVRVLKDSATYSSYLGATQIRDPDPADLPFIRRMMLNQDPPHHRRLRVLVSRAFTPKRVDHFAEVVRERARSLLTRAVTEARAGDGTCDLVTQVTDDYALLNLTDLLGVPDTDRALLLHWTQRVIGYQDPDEAGTPEPGPDGRPLNPRSPSALRDMFDYAHALAAHKRRHPADDVMTSLATDPELTAPELEMFFFLLVVAGNDTVRSAAPGGLHLLAEHSDAYRRLCKGEVGFATAVDELLRRHPPVLTFRRTAREDTVLAGTRIRTGDKVVVFHASANHDERVFPAPHALDLARSPNPHVSFGDGPHVCLGAHFARLQLRALYEETCRALPASLEPVGPPRRLVSNFINGMKSLPVRVGGAW